MSPEFTSAIAWLRELADQANEGEVRERAARHLDTVAAALGELDSPRALAERAIAEKAVEWVNLDGKKNEPTTNFERAAAAMATDGALRALHRLAVDYAYDREHGTWAAAETALIPSQLIASHRHAYLMALEAVELVGGILAEQAGASKRNAHQFYGQAIRSLREGVSAPSPQEPPAQRAILWGLIWRHPKHGDQRVMNSLALSAGYADMGKAGCWSLKMLRLEWTWVSDPDPRAFEPMGCCGRERDKDGGPNPHCECPAPITRAEPLAEES